MLQCIFYYNYVDSAKHYDLNVTGLMSSSSYLCDLLQDRSIDICGISEHWLSAHNSHFINSINSNYKSYIVCDNSSNIYSKRTVGKGGVGILWHVKHDRYVTPVSLNDDSIIGIQIQFNNHLLYVFQIYVPCRNHSIAIFRDYIDRIYDIWVCIMTMEQSYSWAIITRVAV